MAILPLIPGLEVKILVDGVPLVEYQDEDEDVDPRAEEVTRYIECQAGSYFSIQTKFSPHFPCATTDTIVSGVLVNGKSTESVARNLDYRRLRPTSEQMGPSFEENGSWKQQQYQFTDLPKSQYLGISLEAPLTNSRRRRRQRWFIATTQRLGDYHSMPLSRCRDWNRPV